MPSPILNFALISRFHADLHLRPDSCRKTQDSNRAFGALTIQAAVDIPVIGVGGIETGAYVDESLRMKRFSLAAVGRAILRDPKQWRIQNLEKGNAIKHLIEFESKLARC